ncbi:stage III sporulation protein AF, partial [Acidithiobacillus ferrooxidans]|uniref:stage III sporulation protein AF n=2 Tax=Bacteria TaxID=2 RepID=UPI002148ACA3
MIALIGHWVRSLIIIVLLGNLADFVLPKGDLKKYAGLVVGLVLLLAMVSPVWSLIHQVGKSP